MNILILLFPIFVTAHVFSFVTNMQQVVSPGPSSYSLISPSTTTVISLHKGGEGEGIELKFRDMNFACHFVEIDRHQIVRQFKARAQLAPLADVCLEMGFQEQNVHVCPNTRLVVSGEERDVGSIQCHHKEIFHPSVGVICRIGDAVDNGKSVITQTYLNGTLQLTSTRNGRTEISTLSEISCHTDGYIDGSKFFQITSIDQNHVHIASPFCGERLKEPLAPLIGSCLVGSLNNRQIEFCYPNVFRFVQHRPRVGHAWPTATRLVGVPANPLGSVLNKEYVFEPISLSGASCAALQPSLSEEYLVGVSGHFFPAVGGSFMPQLFASSRVYGILVFDSGNPMGCSEKSFPLVPPGPWIALVERSGCMFHDKGLVAQKRGAVGVIVINTFKRGMIPALAGMPGKPVLDIPVVLVDTPGLVLKDFVGEEATVGPPKDTPTTPVTLAVSWYCDADWESERSCQVGDTVGIRREGDPIDSVGRIDKAFSSGAFSVAETVYPGWQLFKSKACTSQLGTRIVDASVNGCEISLKIHSALLCGDPRFRDPPRVPSDIACNSL